MGYNIVTYTLEQLETIIFFTVSNLVYYMNKLNLYV